MRCFPKHCQRRFDAFTALIPSARLSRRNSAILITPVLLKQPNDMFNAGKVYP
jgi:hypothetical protein